MASAQEKSADLKKGPTRKYCGKEQFFPTQVRMKTDGLKCGTMHLG
jgi:hypothetical protein